MPGCFMNWEHRKTAEWERFPVFFCRYRFCVVLAFGRHMLSMSVNERGDVAQEQTGICDRGPNRERTVLPDQTPVHAGILHISLINREVDSLKFSFPIAFCVLMC